MRLPAAPTALSNILAAHLLATAGQPLWGDLLVTLLISFCLYSGGMVMNDCFDLEEDARERPSRPLPAGDISLRAAVGLVLALFLIALLLAVVSGGEKTTVTIGLIALITTYNAGTKKTWAGPVIMGLCRSGNWLLGLAVNGLQGFDLLLCLPIGFFVAAITILSRDETTASDRRHVRLAALTFFLALLSATLLISLALPHPWVAAVPLAGAALIGRRLWALAKTYEPIQIQQTIRLALLGIIPFDAVMALAGAPWWSVLAVLALWYPSWVFSKRIKIT